MPSAGAFVRASDIPGGVGCRLRRVASQSVNSSATTDISWDQEDQDTNGFIAVTATTITIPTGFGGLYAITFHADAPTISGNALVQLNITTGITGIPPLLTAFVDTAVIDRGVIAATTPLLAGDSFTCQVRHVTGSAQNYTAWLACYRVGSS